MQLKETIMIFELIETKLDSPLFHKCKHIPTLRFESESEMDDALDLLQQTYPNQIFFGAGANGYYNAIQFTDIKLRKCEA